MAHSGIVRAGRLVRLGVVVDPSDDPARLQQAAVVCDRAGIDAFWLMAGPDGGVSLTATLDLLASAAEATSTVVLGAWLSDAPRTVPRVLHGRLEITVPADRLAAAPPGVLRVGVATMSPKVTVPQAGLRVLPVGELASAPGASALAVLTRCSIGRTRAEAWARIERELRTGLAFRREDWVFGTLEECQAQVLTLAQRGVVDVRCILPCTTDLPDVIAQLSAVAAGTFEVLSASGRSPDPPAPQGWGGRT